jgi:alpha-beta hydrolase superfamily lysophospholipase
MLIDHTFRPYNHDGWRLDVTRYHDPKHLDRTKKPLVMIPGYGMNTFILNFHPTGASMVAYLCQEGFEVWTANLRGQGGSKREGGTLKYGFRELGLVDFPVVLDLVLDKTETQGDQVHAIGCSLGASVLYGYLAHHQKDHRFASLIAIGGPLRWDKVHPAVKLVFKSPRLAALVPIRGTRTLARTFLPALKKMPWLLSIYMNANQIDLSQADELVKTVDNPNPYLNVQLAKWINNRDLVVDGVNVTEALGNIDDLPILCVLANSDGIVPAEAAKSVCKIATGCCTDVLEVGGEGDDWYAHADLFISDQAHQTVFAPMTKWLTEHP